MASPPSTSSFPAPSTATDTALDTSLDTDPDIDMTIAADPDAEDGSLDFGGDGAKDEDFGMGGAEERNGAREEAAAAEVRLPLRKDVSLREFLGRMDEYAPIIPDAVTAHALTLAGLPPPPPSSTNPPPNSTTSPPSTPHTPLHLSRLLALATQKFIADIAADAYQYSRMRSGNVTSNSLNAQGGVPGAPGAPAVAGAGGAAIVGGGVGVGASAGGVGGAGAVGAGAAGAAGKGEKGGTAAHVLGMQRAGFGGGGQGGGQGRTVLTMEDLGMAVGEYGVNVRRGEFYR